MAASASAFSLIGEDFDSEHYDIRKIPPHEGNDESDDEGDDESDDESVDYIDKELLDTYSD